MVATAAVTERGQHLLDTCGVLWPHPASVAWSGAGSDQRATRGTPAGPVTPRTPGSEFILLLGMRRPRLLIPASPAAGPAAVRGYSAVGSRSARFGGQALALALRSRAGRAAFRSRVRVDVPAGTDTIQSFLSDALGRAVEVSLYVGPARANRKPVLQLLSPDGQPIGFAKLGTTPLAQVLVRDESAALTLLGAAGLTEVTVPEVLFYGAWREVNVLVQSALPVWQRRGPVTPARLTSAMRAVAHVGGVHGAPLATSSYWRRLTGRLASADESAPRDQLLDALSALSARAGDTVLALGSWHGDWTPWNMTCTRGRGLLVWDWERFTEGPLGFDALHYRLQEDLVSGRRDPSAAAVSCVETATRVLAPFEITGSLARIICILYLADLATRYLCDRQAEAGAPLGAVGEWLVPAITAEVRRLCAA